MSIEIMNAVWRESNSSGRARVVLLAIADMQSDIGAWPSIATLAKMTNSSERSVQRDIRHLEEIGELIVLNREAPTRSVHKSNLYWVNLPSIAHKHFIDDEVTNEANEVTNEVDEVTNNADEVTPVGMISLTRTLIEPLKNLYPQNEFEGEKIWSKFIEFYNLYPRKNGKQDAFKAFKKVIKNESFDVILAGVIRLANDPNKPAKQYLPYPATWLNAGGWEDEPYPERVLTVEEKQAQAQVLVDKRRLADAEHSKRLKAEMQAAQAAYEANPPEPCQHRAVKLLCKICN